MKAANKCFSVVGVPQLDFDQCNPDEMIQIVDAVQGIGQQPGTPLCFTFLSQHNDIFYT